MFHEDKQGNVLLSPKTSFALGLVGGVLVLCTLGFFILLGVVMKGGIGEGAKAATKPTAAAPTAPAPTAPAPDEDVVGDVAPVTDADHVSGAKTGYDVTLITYSDFECPYCARFHDTMTELMADSSYKVKIRWVFRNFPLSFHQDAVPAALAAECAADQGKFWEYADALFAANTAGALSADSMESVAKDVGLNASKFKDCYSTKKHQEDITEDQSSGSIAGVSGTPATIILTNDGQKELIPGALPIEQVKAMIDSLVQ